MKISLSGLRGTISMGPDLVKAMTKQKALLPIRQQGFYFTIYKLAYFSACKIFFYGFCNYIENLS